MVRLHQIAVLQPQYDDGSNAETNFARLNDAASRFPSKFFVVVQNEDGVLPHTRTHSPPHSPDPIYLSQLEWGGVLI